MQDISNLNPELLQILTEFSDWFFARENAHLENFIGKNPRMQDVTIKEKYEEATSLSYLKEKLNNYKKAGFPEYSWGLELSHDREYYDDKRLKQKLEYTNEKLMNFFGARNNALMMYYPPGGYIGWHHNGNAPGYNVVLSCNPSGDGEFENWDVVNEKLIVFNDKPGWNCKVGYFGDQYKEPEKLYWHCARTRSPRLTMSYVIYNKNLWEDMVQDISI